MNEALDNSIKILNKDQHQIRIDEIKFMKPAGRPEKQWPRAPMNNEQKRIFTTSRLQAIRSMRKQ